MHIWTEYKHSFRSNVHSTQCSGLGELGCHHLFICPIAREEAFPGWIKLSCEVIILLRFQPRGPCHSTAVRKTNVLVWSELKLQCVGSQKKKKKKNKIKQTNKQTKTAITKLQFVVYKKKKKKKHNIKLSCWGVYSAAIGKNSSCWLFWHHETQMYIAEGLTRQGHWCHQWKHTSWSGVTSVTQEVISSR